MSAWTQFVQPGPALFILVLVFVPQLGHAAPFENSDQSTEIEYYPVADATGCYYNFEHYDEGDRIITNEPCLNCTCHNRMLMCYLRVCPFTKAIGQNCKVEKKADQCCPVITCPEVPVQLVPHASTTPSTQVGHPSDYGCSIDNLFYADGAKVPSNPDNPCEVCYCIRNKTACIIQECTLTGEVVEGCRPVYVDGVCCPVRYDCEHPQLETTTRPLLTTTTTTLPPTSSPADCIYNNEIYSDGALVKKDVPCEQCYCMRGDIVCAVQECGPTPLDKVNCTALPAKEGQCCPDTYECENISEEDLTTLSYFETPTTQPTIVSSDEETSEPAEEISATKTSVSEESPAEVTEGQIIQSTGTIEAEIEREETPITESATTELFTSRVTEAVEAVTSRVTQLVEAITSTIIGSEEVTTQPETGTESVNVVPEAATTPEQPTITEQGLEITQAPIEQEQPITESIPETEDHSEHETVEPETYITEGYTQRTKIPDSDEQKLVTVPESSLTITTESVIKESEIEHTESPEIITDNIDHIAHDGHEEPEEEPSEDDNELTEGSGKPLAEPVEPHITIAPEDDGQDKQTRPADQSQTEKEPQVTEQYDIQTTASLPGTLPSEGEHDLTEGSGVSEERTPTTVAPEYEVTETEELAQTTLHPLPELDVNETITTVVSKESATSSPEEAKETEEPQKPASEESIIPQHCDQESCQPVSSVTEPVLLETIQPLAPEQPTTQSETEGPTLLEVEATVSEEEQPHADVTKQPDQVAQEITTVPSKEQEKEILTPIEDHKEEELSVDTTESTIPQAGEESSIPTQQDLTTDTKEKEDEHITTERQEEELEFVTEIPTKETEKPQSMDHVYETIVPDTTSERGSEVQEQETERNIVPVETEGTTELPKEDKLEKIDASTSAELEKATESPQTEEANIPLGVNQTPVACNDDNGCAPEQEENEGGTAITEDCTKESCSPHGEVPQSEGGTEPNLIPQEQITCNSEHDCVSGLEKEGVTESSITSEHVPSAECNAEQGCTPISEDKLLEKPICNAEQGCVPEKEAEVTPQPCANELDCIPSIPEKEGEISKKPSEEACEPGFDCGTGKEETATDNKEIQEVPDVTATEITISQEQTTISITYEQETPEQESSGQQPTTEIIETVPAVTELTEGSGEYIGDELPVTEQEEISEGTKAPKLSSDEKLDQETDQTVIPERVTETVPIEPEILHEDQDRTEASPEISDEGTELPVTDISKTPQDISTLSSEVPEVTQIPVQITPEVEQEIDNEIVPEGSTSTEIVPGEGISETSAVEHESTIAPEPSQTESSTAEEIVPEVTALPGSIETEGTQSPELTVTENALAPGSISSEVTQTTKEIITETEFPQTVETTQTPKQSSVSEAEAAQETEGVQFAENTTLEQIIPESTPQSETVAYGPVTITPETSEGTKDITGTPEQIAPESTQPSNEVGGTESSPGVTGAPEQSTHEILELPEEPSSEGTSVPPNVTFEGTIAPQESTETTESPEVSITDVTQPPEQVENTEIPAQISSETVKYPEEPVPSPTELPKEEPEQITPEGTTLRTEVGSTEVESLMTTQPSERIASESTDVPKAVSESTQLPTLEPAQPETTETTEQILPESTYSPKDVTHDVTQIPDITPETSEKLEESETPEYVKTEIPEVTQPEQYVTEVVTEAVTAEIEVEHGIPGEGSCLVDGQTYKNNSNVPPFNQCQTSCRCVSSILQCESVSCTPPPSNLQDCMPIFHSRDSCCPTYSCSVPGATSMESDSHIIETTTVIQEEEGPTTTDIQVISGEPTTVLPEISGDKSEGETTIKSEEEPFVTVKAETITEIPQHVTELATSIGTGTPVIEEESTGTISDEITTQKSGIPEVTPDLEVSPEVHTTEIGKDIVPASQTTIYNEATTISTNEIATTEELIEPNQEQQPTFDQTENEVPEEPIVPEQCSTNGCAHEGSVIPQDSEQPVTIAVTEAEVQQESKVTEQPAKEDEVRGSEETSGTEQAITEEYVTPVHISPSEPSQTYLPDEPSAVSTDIPEIKDSTTSVVITEKQSPESVTENIVEEKPTEIQYVPVEPETPGEEQTEKTSNEIEQTEISTGDVSEPSPTYTEETSELATEGTSKSPEEMAAIPEIEEVATVLSILPETITGEAITETEEASRPEGGEQIIPTTEYHIDDINTESSVQGEGVTDEVSSPPIVIETQKPEKPEVQSETGVTGTEGYPVIQDGFTEHQTETPAIGKITIPSDKVETTGSQQDLETTPSSLIHITEFEEGTSKPESAAHVTEPTESEKLPEITTIREDVSSETVTENLIEPEEISPETVTPTVPETEIKQEDQFEERLTTEAHIPHETAEPSTVEPDHPEPVEITTISGAQDKITQISVESEEKETDKTEASPSVTEPPQTEEELLTTAKEQGAAETGEGRPTQTPTDKETEAEYSTSVTEAEIKEGTVSESSSTEAEQYEKSTEISATEPTAESSKPHTESADTYTSPEITTQLPTNVSGLYTSGPYEEPSTKKYVEGELSTSVPLTSVSTVEPTTAAPTFAPPPVPGHDIPGEHVPEIPDYHTPEDYEYEDQGPLGPGTCRYGGKVYVSAQQIPRDDPCDFCFCFRSDIICLQQSCPPPIPKCHEEPIRGFCCPRYECPVGMATAVNITTSTTTTTTTLPPHFLSHAYKGRVKRTGCQIKGKAYRVGEDIESASGPCLHCTCGGDGEMKCDPKVCSPEPMLRQMIAAATSRRRR